jgi:hypothetical protein
MTSEEIEMGIKSLLKFDLVVSRFNLSLSSDLKNPPMLEFDRKSYPGFEAHLFTIADASLWHPELTETSNVVLRDLGNAANRNKSWNRLLSNTLMIMDSLLLYREGLKHGIIPSSHWIYHEFQWYRENWDPSIHESDASHDFLHSVDESIRPLIKELNELGFLTTQSCSGLSIDHPNREPYLPYVMFDERAYPKASAHLFALADMTGWIPSYGPHNFDVELKLRNAEQAEDGWDKLISGARHLTSLLVDYRLRFKTYSNGHEQDNP